MLTVRPAAMSDLDAMTDIEAQSFPPEEKATRESFEARMKVFPECFMLLCEDGRPVGLIDGMVTNDATISDPMFENASLHDPKGAWQSIFGFCVLPEMRGRGAAPLLMRAFIEKARAAAASSSPARKGSSIITNSSASSTWASPLPNTAAPSGTT